MSDNSYAVEYSYNVTGAVQTEEVTVQTKNSAQARRVAEQLLDHFHQPSKYNPYGFSTKSVEDGTGITREQWSSVVEG